MVRPPNTGLGLPWSSSDPCPCGSAATFGDCCFSPPGALLAPAISLRPPGAKTGRAQDGCYLAPSLNCDGGLSREHYITKALIQGRDLKVRGFPWQREEVMKVSPDNLTARILCRRHNSVLSPLDTVAKHYFLSLEQAHIHAVRRSLATKTAHYLASGYGMELWAMKTLAGLYASGMDFETERHRFRDYEPPMEQLVEALSSEHPQSLLQLSIPMELDDHEATIGRRAVSVGPLIEGEPQKLAGLLIRMHGIGMHFRLPWATDAATSTAATVRPDVLDLHGPRRTSRFYFAWAERPDEGRIVCMDLAHRRRGPAHA